MFIYFGCGLCVVTGRDCMNAFYYFNMVFTNLIWCMGSSQTACFCMNSNYAKLYIVIVSICCDTEQYFDQMRYVQLYIKKVCIILIIM